MMKFKNKAELIQFVKKQCGIELENGNNCLNNKRNLLYTSISRANRYNVLSVLKKYNVMYEQHINNYYFIRVR